MPDPLANPLYVRVSRAPSPVALGLTLNPDEELVAAGLSVGWTLEARDLLKGARREVAAARDLTAINLPYGALRVLFQLEVPNLARLVRSVGLGPSDLRKYRAEPFLFVEGGDASTSSTLHRAATQWIDQVLLPWTAASTTATTLARRLRSLTTAGNALVRTPTKDQLVPWNRLPTGSTGPDHWTGFRSLADWAALRLAGAELLPSTGAWRRVVSRRSDNSAELLSWPVTPVAGGPSFAFRLKLTVETSPFTSQPVLKLSLGKRRFLEKLPEGWTRSRRISGHVWSEGHPARVFTFDVVKGKAGWEPGRLMDSVIERLGLNAHAWDADGILKKRADSTGTLVRLVHQSELGRSSVKAGVPERDKLDLYRNVQRLLAPQAVTLEFPESLKRRSRPVKQPVRPKADALLWALAEAQVGTDVDKPALEGTDVEETLRGYFDVVVADLHKIGADPTHWAPQGELVNAIQDSNAEALSVHRPQGCAVVLIADARLPRGVTRLARESLRLLLGHAVPVHSVEMPPGTSGPRADLPLPSRPAKERFDARVAAWKDTAAGIRQRLENPLCIVLSPMWFGADGETGRPDDRVNKAAGRHALATEGGACVQYLLPPDWTRGGKMRIGSFLYRVQAALSDVAYAHAGRIDQLRERVASEFAEARPREIIGISVVRRNANLKHERSFIAVAVKLDIGSGRAFVRFGTRGADGSLRSTTWHPLSKGLSLASSLTPALLGERRNEQKSNFQQFVISTLDEATDAGTNAVVLVDSSNCATLWPWLADKRVNPDNVEIAGRSFMQDDWQGIRLVRVRAGCFPQMFTDIRLGFAPGDPATTTPPASAATMTVQQPTTAPAGVYRIRTASTPRVFVSVAGQPDTFQQKRGVSCYRDVDVWTAEQPRMDNASNERLGKISCRGAVDAAWSTPEPVELTVLMARDASEAEAVARFVHELRRGYGHYSGWTKLPAPLFFGRVVRDYLCAFDIENAAAEE